MEVGRELKEAVYDRDDGGGTVVAVGLVICIFKRLESRHFFLHAAVACGGRMRLYVVAVCSHRMQIRSDSER